MPVAAMDEAMVRFADGEGDVLLATSIIESGLDVPRANTMLVWRADRFGLAQLHQLRGRVGRGRARGICYLLTEPGTDLPEATRKRLQTLEALDRLGAGFAVSARDLDLRGAGELLGEEQAGHVTLVGTGLYQHLLEGALRAARGEPVDDWSPELNLGAPGGIPEDYVPEPEVRLNLYARLSRAGATDEIEALADEIADRFGPIPEAMAGLFDVTRLRILCRRAGVARVDAGPAAIALSFRPEAGAGPELAGIGPDSATAAAPRPCPRRGRSPPGGGSAARTPPGATPCSGSSRGGESPGGPAVRATRTKVPRGRGEAPSAPAPRSCRRRPGQASAGP
jgi:transcription-repair coupling factor (superfamily II helicase)